MKQKRFSETQIMQILKQAGNPPFIIRGLK